MDAQELLMKRCIELALRGAGRVAPNPMVGCVITHSGSIISEGYHQQFGEAHAEVNAIRMSTGAGLLHDSTLYVNLEPCNHFGKTPPCTDLIISERIPRVVIGCEDQHPVIAGNGIRQLKESGIEVLLGVLEPECLDLNKRFFTFYKKQRPYVILKWAQTQDGYIGSREASIRISNRYAEILVHQWRSEESAILVGTRTALQDNPRLDARFWNQRNPLRVVLDRHLSLPEQLHLFDHSIPTLVFTEKKRDSEHHLEFVTIPFGNAVPESIVHELWKRNILSLVVEGGSILLQSFIDQGIWDEARIFTAPHLSGGDVRSPLIHGTVAGTRELEGDLLTLLKPSL